MKKLHLIISLLIIEFGFANCQSVENDLQGPYLGQKPPGKIPEIFMPGLLNNEYPHGSPVFTADGNEVYFPGIMYMKRINGKWTKLNIAPFSGTNRDVNPTITSDGKKIFYCSQQMGNSMGPIVHHMVAEKNGEKWNKPKTIDYGIDSIPKGWQISVSNSDAIYFSTSKLNSFGMGDIYKSEYKNGNYSLPINLGNRINSTFTEGDPFISPDEDYIIFTSYKPGGKGNGDLYISFLKSDNTWCDPINLGDDINSKDLDIWPNVSPDRKYLFFISNRNQKTNIYWVSTDFIEELKPKTL